MSLVIRPSSLPSYADCPRRTVARSIPALVRDAGFELPQRPGSIGAMIGTATHAAVAYTLTEKMNRGELGNATEAEQRGLEALQEETADGVLWDDTSPNKNSAEKQVVRLTTAYRRVVAPNLEPVAVEQRYEAEFGPFVVGGTVDTCTDGVRDLKTGKMQRMNIAQYGCYSLLRRANGEPVANIFEDYVPRVALTKPQPDPVSTPYPVDLAEKIAKSIVIKMARDVTQFQESGNPLEFAANPMSMLCNPKFCPAHGTDFCPETKLLGE